MTRIRKKAEQARRELRSYKGQPPRFPLSEAMRWWHLKYTGLIIDFMCDELPDVRLGAWKEVFTALHELAGAGYRHFEDSDVVTEEQAWRRVDAAEHMAFCRLFSLNPPPLDPTDFVVEYQEFFLYLGRRGVLSDDLVEALVACYEQVLTMRAA